MTECLNPLRRWVFGGGQSDAGYVLSHPKIGEYLQRNRFAAICYTNPARVRRLGQGALHCAESRADCAQSASPYCLQFLPEHLKQASASPEDFMIMVENGWRLAWENFEGGQRGFASAVKTAFAAQNEDKPRAEIGGPVALRADVVVNQEPGRERARKATAGGGGQGRAHNSAGGSFCGIEGAVRRERRVVVRACACCPRQPCSPIRAAGFGGRRRQGDRR